MKNKKILIFDDDHAVLEALQIILQEAGYEIAVSDTTDKILEKIINFLPDVILMDNFIPPVGGVEAVKLLWQNNCFNHIPIILISADNNIENLKNISGADEYLRKPFDLLELDSLLAKTLKSNTFLK